jgi:uncharacterized protein (UPF0335 family)
MRGPGDIPGDQLRAIVERIEHIEEEIKELTEVKKEIYAEAKGNGFDVKILREVIRIRKQDQKEREEQESLLDTYLHALGMAAPVSKAA